MSKEKFSNLYVWIGIVLAFAGYGYQMNDIFLASTGYADQEGSALGSLCYLASWICFIPNLSDFPA
jgi:hypothetical protein